MAKQKKELMLSMEGVEFLYGNEFDNFGRTVKNVFCLNCNDAYNSEIINFNILLNDLNDLELNGFCKKCGNKVGRYIETGEMVEYANRIEAIRIANKFEK